jgi:thiamine monophosphate synthase
MVKIERRKNRFPRHPLAIKAGVDAVFFMTDTARGFDGLKACEHLPKGTYIIFRDYEAPDRDDLAFRLRLLTRKYQQYLLIAGDERLARKVGADGIHLPEYMLAKRLKTKDFGIVTAACHNRAAMKRADEMGADYMFVSPVFATRSHPEAKPLEVHRLMRLINCMDANYVALGGVNAMTAQKLRVLTKISGIAAIEGLVT